MDDLLIRNAWIIDGTGKERFLGNVGIKDGKVFLRETSSVALKSFDATGLCICPGFIDSHSHGDQAFGKEYSNLSKSSQGITTQITGHCGLTPFPVSFDEDKFSDLLRISPYISSVYGKGKSREFTSFSAFRILADTVEQTSNYAMLVGHSAIRTATMGLEARAPSERELRRMKKLLAQSLAEGAIGMSTGLLYAPGSYALTSELVELAHILAKHDAVYATHLRDEADQVVGSIHEAIKITKTSGARLNISHHKIFGKNNHGKSIETLELMKEAAGCLRDLWTDIYPYTASMTSLYISLPQDFIKEGVGQLQKLLALPEYRKRVRESMKYSSTRYNQSGGFSGVMIAKSPTMPECEGKTIDEYARLKNLDPFDVYFDILASSGTEAQAIYFGMDREDLFRIVQEPFTLIGSDGLVSSFTGTTHPRSFGTFPRAIDLFWRQKGIFSLEEIISKMTSEAAKRWRLPNKGRILDGYDADLVLFDQERIKDSADYLYPTRLSEGIERVLVSGQTVYHNKRLTGNAPGKFISSGREGIK
jgi:N-acyl-D-amino-acid deacylase